MQSVRRELCRRIAVQGLWSSQASLASIQQQHALISIANSVSHKLDDATVRSVHTSSVNHQAEALATEADTSTEPLLQYSEGASMTPSQVVSLLDKHIVGQADAKRAVANALRSRWRRRRVPSPMKEDIVPKNILMIGPTGCGKTEIARRLAKLADAPFVKVEATKYTEVGFHGRDVDQIIRDLLDNAMVMVKLRMRTQLRERIAEAVERRIIDAMAGPNDERDRASFRDMYRQGQLDNTTISVDMPVRSRASLNFMPVLADNPGVDVSFTKQLGPFFEAMQQGRDRRTERREMTVAEARKALEESELESLTSQDVVIREAINAVEQDGIVFIDEIDKIVTSSGYRYGADASSEGVQRDLLPIIEGSIVTTKHGNIDTNHILFICSGAFHNCKPSDMLAELQGRLPIRVELKGLTRKDFYRILTEPEHNMIKQQVAMMATEGVDLVFTEGAIQEIAAVAEEVNRALDNIGARRLYTILERILEDVSFKAPDLALEAQERGEDGPLRVTVDKEEVRSKMADLLKKQDLSRFVL